MLFYGIGHCLLIIVVGTSAGAAKNAMLAINISQALYTTAAGLIVAVPAVGFFHFFRNRAAKVLLTMESFTLEMIKRSGQRTVPQVFIDGQCVGGFDELADLDLPARPGSQ
mgnify:CR=1 FL=1